MQLQQIQQQSFQNPTNNNTTTTTTTTMSGNNEQTQSEFGFLDEFLDSSDSENFSSTTTTTSTSTGNNEQTQTQTQHQARPINTIEISQTRWNLLASKLADSISDSLSLEERCIVPLLSTENVYWGFHIFFLQSWWNQRHDSFLLDHVPQRTLFKETVCFSIQTYAIARIIPIV